MYDYHQEQLTIAKELFHKTQYDTVLSILLPELDILKTQEKYDLLTEYLDIIISSYINKSDISMVEPLLDLLNTALINSNHQALKVRYPYHVGCFFFLSNDIERAIEMFEKALSTIENNETHPYYLKISIALISWHLQQNNFHRANYYRKKIQHLIPFTKHEAPQIFSHYMSATAALSIAEDNLDAAYEAIMCNWQHPILMKNAKTIALTACQLGMYNCKKNNRALVDEYFEKCWAACEVISDVQFKLNILSKIIASYEQLANFEASYRYSKMKIDMLESVFLQRQQERLHQFALNAKQDSLNLLAYVDKLTQIYNRHYFEEEFDLWLHSAKQTKSQLCCALFDVDNFKEKNDAYGHVVGDSILRSIGATAKKYEVPGELFIARYGGDEFIIVSKDPSLFKYTIELLFEELQAIEIAYENTSLSFTVSLGAAIVEDVSNFKVADIIQKADEQLYHVKRSGKNDFQLT